MKRRLHPALESPEVRAKRQHLRNENARFTETLVHIPKDQWPTGYGESPTSATVAVYRSRHFLVQYVLEKPSYKSRLSVNRTELNEKGDSWQDGITWDELMEIKRQCGFESCWAVEVYPPDHQIVNVANMRHLWLLEEPPATAWFKKPH